MLWQDKLKSLIQDPAHRGDHVTETWAALLETKESRIAVMERDVSLLEKELLQQQQLMQQQRDHWARSIEQSNPTTPVPRTATPSQQAAAAVVAAAQLYRHSPVNNGQTAQHKDAVSRSYRTVQSFPPYSAPLFYFLLLCVPSLLVVVSLSNSH